MNINKYQEALDNIDKCRVNKTLNIDIKDILILQELVDKATPKKPEQFGNNEYCPKCHYLGHRFYKYCPYCGQALDFGDEDD